MGTGITTRYLTSSRRFHSKAFYAYECVSTCTRVWFLRHRIEAADQNGISSTSTHPTHVPLQLPYAGMYYGQSHVSPLDVVSIFFLGELLRIQPGTCAVPLPSQASMENRRLLSPYLVLNWGRFLQGLLFHFTFPPPRASLMEVRERHA